MKHAALLGVLVLGAACGFKRQSTGDGPSVPSAPSSTNPAASVRQITVGQDVTGSLEVHGAKNVFELTAPSAGTLVAQLVWPRAQGRLELWLADTLSSQADTPPITGTLTVAAGRTYRVMVADYAAWDYDNLSLPYVLTIAIH